ncbi:FtsX-like permease family protein [Desulfosporosinus acididurans]|uniref:FtsX-like permease family protein n=1 Tax=Desulfosporosinus acididurans TaxID=476652 RepID=A0A0J1FSX5_9FIRM|nr:FtsX-like permease family protein [Desulfosporosinus acididurans]KLU66063.1 FtsX-like permease family protein [Desulfosporosinus acididurans]
MLRTWFKGILTYRPGRLLGSISGVALTVALLASLGAFIASAGASMTQRAVQEVPADWQIQLSHPSDAKAVKAAVGKATPYTALEQVGYADVKGLIATAGGTVQTTGPGKVLGISAAYRANFPLEFRQLVGANQGVLVAQQTAANLHVKPGDRVSIERVGLPPSEVIVDGVVDLPNADSLFQAIGLPAGAAPQAPPDNVLLLPDAQWQRIFGPQAAVRPDSVHTQFHVRIGHVLPADPAAANQFVQQLAHSLEARIVGRGIVGNILATRLGSVQADAAYGNVLFLFLGLPGAILAVLLTMAIASSGANRRRKEQALLRIRGASVQTIIGLEAIEALIVALGGVVLGNVLTLAIHRMFLPGNELIGKSALFWTVSASLMGFALAIAAILYPAWKEIHHSTVVSAQATVGRGRKALWQKVYLDILLLVISGVEFWRTASTGYQVVLAPEGITTTSVNYEAFVAPLCFWLGAVLFSTRFLEGWMSGGRKILARMLNPVARELSGVVSSSLSRQRLLIVRGIILVALAVSFAVSTAVFNTTYNAQSHVDAELTNGADVTVTGSIMSAPSTRFGELQALPGVAAIQPMQHRLVYVGNDLQDMYGIDPQTIGQATNIANAYFVGGNAQGTLAKLSKQPDGVLVSEETVKDYQLKLGDKINLRLQNIKDHQYHVVPFHFIGIVREFPTAPKDSFLVANRSYIGQETGSDASEIVLMRAKGNPEALASRAKTVVSSLAGAKVTDINSTQRTISSGLTAVDLHGLTRLELGFAVLLAAASTGLILALGLAERRRTLAVLAALGAKKRQLGAFVWSEGLVILTGGSLLGVILGLGVAEMLVKVLTGVFDPPPEVLSIPWGYLVLLAAAAISSTAAAIFGTNRLFHRPAIEEMRGL